jgi:hypothetical protein
MWEWLESVVPLKDLPYINTVIAASGVAVAVIGFLSARHTYLETKRRESFKLGVDLILKLGERFEREDMRLHRSRTAMELLNGTLEDSAHINFVLDFFEEIGFLLARGALDVESVYTFFSYWIRLYYFETMQWREEARREDGAHDVFQGIESMFQALKKFRPEGFNPLTSTEREDSLATEAALIGTRAEPTVEEPPALSSAIAATE